MATHYIDKPRAIDILELQLISMSSSRKATTALLG